MTTPQSTEDFKADLQRFMADANEWLTSQNAESAPITEPIPAPAPAPTPAPSPGPAHAKKPGVASREPVAVAQAFTVLLGSLVTAGWLAIPDSTVMIVGSVLAFLLSGVATVMARARVAPVNSTWFEVIMGSVGDLVRSELDERDKALRTSLAVQK